MAGKVSIVTVKKPKGRPRGPKGSPQLKPHHFTSETARAAQAKRKTFSGGSAKISVAYAMLLSEEAPDEVKRALGIDAEQKATWSDLIAYQAGKRALGLVDSDKINFTAIQEMREVTEGRVADKLEQSGPNGTPLVAPTIGVRFVRPQPREDDPIAAGAAKQSMHEQSAATPIAEPVADGSDDEWQDVD